MYGHLSIVDVGPGVEKRNAAEDLARHVYPLLKQFRGFRGATYFGNQDTGEYGVLSMWETFEDYEAAAQLMTAEKTPKKFEGTFEIYHSAAE